ncbi:SpoIID/LytB domain-containing protein [Nocardioides sp. Kera G14]|uniref:SpoIID/LytB domain-containing protein n=1 Tax=Nocardioides sp. Kera G14 TaxID=2884264 RepID=UPI001D122901|nr:SpoIID/LytB domain-containing protein [Nocardioides sp. Kera G14]UDY24430.1 SpoIID/LytB domain-containing protein [Nocardioides sp. Kera G14]
MPRLSRATPFSHAVAGLLLVTAAVLALGPADATTKTIGVKLAVPKGAKLALTGHGYGHGRGLSQYGAEGAARQGRTAAQILSFYYPGTAMSKVGGSLTVLIGPDTTPDTVVKARSGLVVRTSNGAKTWNLAAARPTATQWRLNPLSATKTAIGYRIGSARWKRLGTSTSTLEFWAGGSPITLVLPASATAYRGALRNAPFNGRDHDTVNVVGLEDYLKGVVASEMPSSWKPAALQSQAIAARTYAAYSRAHAAKSRQYQICDSTACQVYKGVAGETKATNAAIAATAGQMLAYAGQPAFTQFSSSSGGWTVAGSVAYQKAQADPYDAWAGNSQHTWTVKIDPKKVAAAWPALGTLTSLQVLARDGHGDWGGRVTKVQLTGTKGQVKVSGDSLRSALGLKSTYFDVAVS